MKVLFLGEPDNPLVKWLREEAGEEEVVATRDKITHEWCENEAFDFAVSYNYKHLIRQPILDLFPDAKIINLHISYLPYNRGMHPNVWSFVEGTPKGVTIHVMEAGLDTGDILVQKEVDFDSCQENSCNENGCEWTLASSYQKLQSEIQDLFKANWAKLRIGEVPRSTQRHDLATFHYGRDLNRLDHCFGDEGWECAIHRFLERVEKENNLNP